MKLVNFSNMYSVHKVPSMIIQHETVRLRSKLLPLTAHFIIYKDINLLTSKYIKKDSLFFLKKKASASPSVFICIWASHMLQCTKNLFSRIYTAKTNMSVRLLSYQSINEIVIKFFGCFLAEDTRFVSPS